ncbi:hypothetical protein VNO77_04954 [Canavalia gladiata]|uniref:E3 ubiquitin-protein ligase RMA n=1 Tax=Canavalia gladiata TaxID=3824 RepID=A0AAN9MXF4_CANGL
MAFERYVSQEWKSISNPVTETENLDGCFDCNICLDFAHEPIVTLCGHLYCWPCIYKWLHVQSASLAPDEHPQCPVCKDDICHTTMVPLYGRGQALAHRDRDEKASYLNMFIPPRPPALGAQSLLATPSQSGQQLPYRNPYQNQHFNPPLHQEEDDTSSQMLNLGATMAPGFPHLVVGMFGEMFYARVFGNSENLYTYPNPSYHMVGSNSPRLRRQEMQAADKSLNRISIFLLCCFILCLIFDAYKMHHLIFGLAVNSRMAFGFERKSYIMPIQAFQKKLFNSSFLQVAVVHLDSGRSECYPSPHLLHHPSSNAPPSPPLQPLSYLLLHYLEML